MGDNIMAKIVVGGSIAYDNIMDFPGYFKEHILPDKIDTLNVSFLVSGLKKVRGGTAPNISYNLALVGQSPVVLGTAGKDFYEYKSWLNENGVSTDFVRILEDDYTASCFIITDLSNNQITGFYPGAMAKDPEISLKELDMSDVDMVIVAPTEPAAMLKWVKDCKELRIPYLFDPGMQIPRLSPQALTEGLTGAEILIYNEYEHEMLMNKTGLSQKEILDRVNLEVTTLGEKGSVLRKEDKEVFIPAAKPSRVADPTGAGDAYRAGLLKGWFENASLSAMGQYASITAVYAVENKGATEHKYTIEEFEKRLRENY